MRISNDAFTDIKRYPSVVNSTAVGESVYLMSAEDLNKLPPNLSRTGKFLKKIIIKETLEKTQSLLKEFNQLKIVFTFGLMAIQFGTLKNQILLSFWDN